MHQSDASVTDHFRSVSKFKLNVASSKHGFITGFGFVPDALLHAFLTIVDPLPSNFDTTLPCFLLPSYTP
jgi:hypothetical protein